MCQPWEREREDKCNNNNVTMFRELVSKVVATPAYLGVAFIVYMQMFRQQYLSLIHISEPTRPY